MAGFTTVDMRAAAERLAAAGAAAAAELNAQDGKLGDGDLGITVAAGWQAVADAASDFPTDVGAAFLAAAKAFQQASSSSFGTLVATAFISAAKVTKGRSEVPWSETTALLQGARDAMMARGKAALGDKTVIDSLDAIQRALTDIADPGLAATAAAQAAHTALDEFRNRPNRIGRARMFSDSSTGIDDPGMLAMARMTAALASE
jgi:dihydroxyacetone kinase-like protein